DVTGVNIQHIDVLNSVGVKRIQLLHARKGDKHAVPADGHRRLRWQMGMRLYRGPLNQAALEGRNESLQGVQRFHGRRRSFKATRASSATTFPMWIARVVSNGPSRPRRTPSRMAGASSIRSSCSITCSNS